MNSQKSPGGSTFPYYYKGGELHCLKYGSFHKNKEALLELMKREETFICSKPNRRLNIWVDFYETEITEQITNEFKASIDRIRNNIVKLAIVGLSLRGKWRMQRALKRSAEKAYPVRFFNDPERAKTWLVGKSFD